MKHETHASPEIKTRIRNLMRDMPGTDGGSRENDEPGMLTMADHQAKMDPMRSMMEKLMDLIENVDDVEKLRKAVAKLDPMGRMKETTGEPGDHTENYDEEE